MKVDISQAECLAELLLDADVRLVDIGGRGAAFGPVLPLAPVAHYYTCEPDLEEAERLKEALPGKRTWRSLTVLTEAIAERAGDAALHITSQPGMSSLLEPDPVTTGRLYLHSKFEVIRSVTVPTMRLDDAAERYGFGDACFLKLDTQGTELDILRSGERIVGQALGVHCECNFQPYYRGQAVFADVDGHLRERGFTLFGLSRTTLRRNGYRPERYSKRMATWSHCLYLREPDTLRTADAETARRRLVRLLGLALVFLHHDLAFEIVHILAADRLISESDAPRLAADVDEVSRKLTRHVTRKAREHDIVDGVLAPSYRDAKQLE